jgi:hypothetical protein
MKPTVLSFMCQKIAPNETTFGLGLCSPVWYSMTAGGKLCAPYSGMAHNRCALAPPTIYPIPVCPLKFSSDARGVTEA